jgi:hypothetical protein
MISFHENNTIAFKTSYAGRYLGTDGTTTSNLKNYATTLTNNEKWWYTDRTVDTLVESATF